MYAFWEKVECLKCFKEIPMLTELIFEDQNTTFPFFFNLHRSSNILHFHFLSYWSTNIFHYHFLSHGSIKVFPLSLLFLVTNRFIHFLFHWQINILFHFHFHSHWSIDLFSSFDNHSARPPFQPQHWCPGDLFILSVNTCWYLMLILDIFMMVNTWCKYLICSPCFQWLKVTPGLNDGKPLKNLSFFTWLLFSLNDYHHDKNLNSAW